MQVAPDTWHIINDQDVVAKAPKFLVLYKRAGHRVIINRLGDMIVRPSFIEITTRNGSACFWPVKFALGESIRCSCPV